MDRYVIIQKDNNISGFIGDVDIFNTIATVIDDNGIICLYGPPGTGKTYMTKLALRNKSWVEVNTISDIPMLSESTCHVVVDSITPDKSILDYGKKLSKGATIIITRTIEKITFCDCLKVDVPSIDILVKIGMKHYPRVPPATLKRRAMECNGDIRSFLFYIQFPDKRDTFKTSKEYITDLLCRPSENPIMKEIGREHADHGYIWNVIQANYIHVSDDPYIAELLSAADIYDTMVYGNSWDLMPYFWISAMIYPIQRLNKPIPLQKMTPGSCWTKFSNAKARARKYRNLPCRDILVVLRDMILKRPTDEVISYLQSYNIKPPDIDTINHTSLSNKIPVKKIQEIKKKLALDH